MPDGASIADEDTAKRHGALHADLALWEDAYARAQRVREQVLTDQTLDATTRAYWASFATRMERHAALLGAALKRTDTR